MLEVVEIRGSGVNDRWLSDNSRGGTNLLVGQVADNESHQVVRGFHRVIETRLIEPVHSLVFAGEVGAHVGGEQFLRGDTAAPCNAIGRRILLRGNCSAVNILRIRVHEWVYTAVGLVCVEPVHTGARRRGLVENLKRDQSAGCVVLSKIDNQDLTAGWVWLLD